LLVVFIGVTAGFLLNTWRQENSEMKLERKYLTSFYSDIVSDETSLDSLVFHSQTKTDKLMVIIRETGLKNRPLDEELAQSIVNEILYIEWFSASNDTYEDIINSGNLNLVSDYSLKEKISSYYNLLDEVNNVEEFYKDHINNYGLPILYKNYHLLNHKFINKESYQSLEFTNMYLGVTALFQQNNKIYREALQKNRELKSELAEALKLKE
jgi:hypothetical protein